LQHIQIIIGLSFHTHDEQSLHGVRARVDEASSAMSKSEDFKSGLSALPSEKEKANAFVNAPLPKQAGAPKEHSP